VRAGDTLVVPKLDRLARSVPDARDIDAVLIRPDGYIAWSGTDGQPLETALARWFG
jgi:DNA invertase Pin-like site-specific DNA recombinase